VNLASRLCDRAGAWEILVSDRFHEMLPSNIRTRFERTEPLRFKHVTQLIATYRFSAAMDVGEQTMAGAAAPV
jgi:class 3 adenylate cyclase